MSGSAKPTERALAGVLVVDKEAGPTSHDVVALTRRAFGQRRVGHAGTLDPFATGVLVIGIGEGTKLLTHLVSDDKAYEAVVRLGATTDTLDLTGQVVETRAVPVLSISDVVRACEPFVGRHAQRAPAFSAIKQGGEPLYAKARRGEVVDAPVREVELRSFSVEALHGDEVSLSIACSAGFYVRSFARDLALALGTVGHLKALRRVRSGSFSVRDAVSSATLRATAMGDASSRAEVTSRILLLRDAWGAKPVARLTEQGLLFARHGRALGAEHIVSREGEGEHVGLVDSSNALVAIARADGASLKIERGFHG